ncbi:hypothetical protein [Cellulosilyticum ruminicola]|uniref:hypothetical protein n=1 Tax=Cellulosilyticum ruminicola TaxID=425254 RepID=UPI00155DAD2D|nr:hypothetical protein [Cellulosilyticum ruminicola]
MKIKIGYQGMIESNALAAAQKMCEQLTLKDVIYIPLVTSAGITDFLFYALN